MRRLVGAIAFLALSWSASLASAQQASELSERYQIAEELGRGNYKTVYAVEGHPELALGIARHIYWDLPREKAALETIAAAGVPTATILETGTYKGVRAYLQKRFATGDRAPDWETKRWAVLNETSIEDVHRIEAALVAAHMGVGDAQFLVASDGHVVLADPSGTYENDEPASNAKPILDQIEAQAHEAIAARARAKTATLADQLLDRLGETIDLDREPALGQALVDRGLVSRATKAITIDRKLVERVVANQAFWNDVRRIRYHVGDRIWRITQDADRSSPTLARNPMSEAATRYRLEAERRRNAEQPPLRPEPSEDIGDVNHGAVIRAINPDGTYDVEIWDRTLRQRLQQKDANDTAHFRRLMVDPSPADVLEASGIEVEVENPRRITMTQEQVDAANGFVDPGKGGTYTVNGINPPEIGQDAYTLDLNVVSPERDPVLRDYIDRAQAIADSMIADGRLDLSLPLDADPASRRAALRKISLAQLELVHEIYDRFRITRRNEWGILESPDRIDGKIAMGSYKREESGACSATAEWIVALVREVGRRTGIDIRGIRSVSSGHSRYTFRTADGSWYLGEGYSKQWARSVVFEDGHWLYFTDHGPRPEDRTAFASPEERRALERGGVSTDFFERLDARAAAATAPAFTGDGLPPPSLAARGPAVAVPPAGGAAPDAVSDAIRARGRDVPGGPRTGIDTVLEARIAEGSGHARAAER